MPVNLQKRIYALRKKGARGRGRWLRVFSGPDPQGRIVISVRRKFGNAVKRNRIRRQIRAICREVSVSSWTSRLTLFSVDDRAGGTSYADLRKDLREALVKAGLGPESESYQRIGTHKES